MTQKSIGGPRRRRVTFGIFWIFRMFVSRRTFLSVLEHENIPLRYSKNNPSRTKPLPAYSSV